MSESKNAGASKPVSVGDHAVGSVIFFGDDLIDMRVKVERIDERAKCIWVRTADLRDAGTPLVLDLDKVRLEADAPAGLIHRDGLVELNG